MASKKLPSGRRGEEETTPQRSSPSSVLLFCALPAISRNYRHGTLWLVSPPHVFTPSSSRGDETARPSPSSPTSAASTFRCPLILRVHCVRPHSLTHSLARTRTGPVLRPRTNAQVLRAAAAAHPHHHPRRLPRRVICARTARRNSE